MTRRSQQYPRELRERAMRMILKVTPNYDSQRAAITAVAQSSGGQRRQCAGGCVRPRSTPVSGLGSLRMSRLS